MDKKRLVRGIMRLLCAFIDYVLVMFPVQFVMLYVMQIELSSVDFLFRLLLADLFLQPRQECLGISQAPPCILLHFQMPDLITEIHNLGCQVSKITALLDLADGPPVVVALRLCFHIGV